MINDIAELAVTEILIGATIRLGTLFYNFIHKIMVVPILYINGNFLKGDNALYADATTAYENVRQYHMHLAQQYYNDMSLHKYDIIEKTSEEWKAENINHILGIGSLLKNVPLAKVFYIIIFA